MNANPNINDGTERQKTDSRTYAHHCTATGSTVYLPMSNCPHCNGGVRR